MIKAIIVGFDGSAAAERALRLACDLATKCGASLQISHTPRDETVTFAAEAISGFYIGAGAAQTELLRGVAQEVGRLAEEIAADCGHPDAEVHIGHGDPADDILARAKAFDADLIVTGRRGLGDLRGLVLGSTSHSIAKRADCACMTVT